MLTCFSPFLFSVELECARCGIALRTFYCQKSKKPMSSAIFVAHKHPFCGHLQSAIDAKILSLLHLKSQKSSAYNSFKRFRHRARENLIPGEYYNNTALVCKGKIQPFISSPRILHPLHRNNRPYCCSIRSLSMPDRRGCFPDCSNR